MSPVALLGAFAALPVLVAVQPARGVPARAALTARTCDLVVVDRARTPSRRCLACHDGSIATAALARGHADPGGDHPLDVDYPSAEARHPRTLRPRSALPPDLPLVDGKIACTTCHDGASREPGRPALTLRGSALCFACHTL